MLAPVQHFSRNVKSCSDTEELTFTLQKASLSDKATLIDNTDKLQNMLVNMVDANRI